MVGFRAPDANRGLRTKAAGLRDFHAGLPAQQGGQVGRGRRLDLGPGDDTGVLKRGRQGLRGAGGCDDNGFTHMG